MASRSNGVLASPSTRVLIKVVLYYVVLIGIGWLVKNDLPATSGFGGFAFEPSLSDATVPTSKAAAIATITSHPGGASAVAAAMIAAALLSLPVAWVYQLTRA